MISSSGYIQNSMNIQSLLKNNKKYLTQNKIVESFRINLSKLQMFNVNWLEAAFPDYLGMIFRYKKKTRRNKIQMPAVSFMLK